MTYYVLTPPDATKSFVLKGNVSRLFESVGRKKPYDTAVDESCRIGKRKISHTNRCTFPLSGGGVREKTRAALLPEEKERSNAEQRRSTQSNRLAGSHQTMTTSTTPRCGSVHCAVLCVLSFAALFTSFLFITSISKDRAEYLTKNDGCNAATTVQTEPQPRLPPNHIGTTTTLPIANAAGTTNTGNVTAKPLPPFPWQWIHIPKTGTSFGNALFTLSCPEEILSLNASDAEEVRSKSMSVADGIQSGSPECRSRWTNGAPRPGRRIRRQWWMGEHTFLKPGLPYNQVFVAIREPIQRLVSQIHYGSKRFYRGHVTEDMNQTAYHYYKEAISPENSYRLDAMMTDFLTVRGKSDPVWNQTTASVWKLDQNKSDMACKVLQQAAWVGITDRFNEAICLLHAMYDFPHHPKELMNMRPGKVSIETMNMTEFGQYYRSFTEVQDDAIWKCAVERFERDLQAFAPHCIVSIKDET